MKQVMLWAGAGQIGMVIARRMGILPAPGRLCLLCPSAK